MPTLINDLIAANGHRTALVDKRGRSSWPELGSRVHRWMGVLAAEGLGPGDQVACVLGNRRETFEILLACLHRGITVVPVNWHLTEPEIAYLITDSECRGLIVEEPYAQVSGRAAARAPGEVPTRLVLGDRDVPGFRAVEPLLAAADPAEPAEQSCGSTMLYTSGTTGAPKGVLNGMFVVGAPFTRVAKLLEYARVVLDVPANERFLLDGPWYHSSQLFLALLALLRGCTLHIQERFDPEATLAVIDAEQISAAHLVPTQLVRLLRLPEHVRRGFSGASLRRVWHGGGPCPPDVKRAMIEWWGPVFLEYYGATEGGVVSLINSHDWLRRPGSVGRAVPPYELVVVDEEGAPVPAGVSGRVFVRRLTGRTFQYHKAPEKTRAVHLAPDKFTYGELGHLDEAGFLYLDGRAQDLIVTGGVNVYPTEVEAVLLAHPAVRDAAVIGVPDHEFGEHVVAVIELALPEPADLFALLDPHCRRSLAGFKTPRAYHVVASLPRDTSGKLRKDALRRAIAPPAPDDPDAVLERTSSAEPVP
ncbi:AMP-binding protein [Micromonospora sp. NPDC049089]|uniref:AMP-binding protein n=1 Tax=Micromonospora sp. NPDC049089 TaxID=3155496 RepID=UPI0033D0F903